MTAQEIISSGLLELYAMGMASAEEVQTVEGWAKQYPEVAAEIAAIEASMESYAQAHAVEPAPEVKDNIFKRINAGQAPVVPMTQRPAAKVYGLSPVWKYVAAASIVLLLGAAILSYSFYNKYQDASKELASTRSELQLQKELAASMHDDMNKMADKNAMPVALKPMPNVADAAARIYWMQNTGEVYVDPTYLPQAPSGMQYQLWAIVDGKPVSGGMITLNDGSKVHLQKMKSFGKVQAFAISLEKAGPEKPEPSKDIIVMGKI